MKVLAPAFFGNVRVLLGAVCVVCAWLFPFSNGLSKDALQQIFALGMFSFASLLFGLSSIPKIPFALLGGGIVLVIFQSNHYLGGGVVGIAGLVLIGVACHVGSHLQRNPVGLSYLLIAIVVAALVNALEGLLQWFGLASDLWPWVVETEKRGLAFGAFRQTNLFATFLCIGTVSAIWLVQMSRVTESMAYFILIILVFSVVASGSRTGALEIVTLTATGVYWRRQQAPKITRLMLAPVLIFVAATYLLPVAAGMHGFGFASAYDRVTLANTNSRFVLWSNALDLIRERPWLGWGWLEAGYGHYVTVFDNRFNELVSHVHNLPLQIAVEFGLPIAVIFSGLIIWGVGSGKPWRINSDQNAIDKSCHGRGYAWLMVVFVVGIHSMLEFPLWSSVGFLFITGFAIGYLFSLSPVTKVRSAGLAGMPLLASISAFALILLATLAWLQYVQVLALNNIPFNDREAQRVALADAQDAWLFRGYLDFVTLSMTPVSLSNASDVKQKAEKVLHFSQDPNVIKPLLLSLWYLNDTDALRFHTERFCRAFPYAFREWGREYSGHPILDVATKHTPIKDSAYCSN